MKPLQRGLIITVCIAASSACSGPHAADPAASAIPSVAVGKVTRGDLSQTLAVAAEFRPFQEIEVHAKVAGYVKSINVDVGDRVAAGQLLAVLEVPEMQDELQQGVAAISHADEEINRAQADLDRTQSVHELAHLSASRLESVIKARPNLVAQQDIDDAAGRDRVAEAQVATAKAALAGAQQQLAIARANQAKTQTLFAYTRITAPFAGVITHRYADVGAMIQAGTASQTQTMPIVKLSENSLLRLTIPIPESAVSHVHLGQQVTVRVSALDQTLSGVVSRFASEVDNQTRTMHTEVDVKNPTLALVPGMYATAEIMLDRRPAVLSVPIESLDRATSGTSVMVVDADHRIERREVSLGLETPERVEVSSGLREDDLVVLGNRTQLKPGTTVAPQLAAVQAEK
jgi:RND family efflux transporter MFP subunit